MMASLEHIGEREAADRPRLFWCLAGLYLLAVILLTGWPTPAAQVVGALGILLALGLAVRMRGLAGAALMGTACLVITFAIENIGVATGFPFGHYHFNVDRELPYIGAVPLIVGPLYFGIGYYAWSVAGILLDDADLQLDKRNAAVALPIAAAFLTVQWDVVVDPASSTLYGAWSWHQGGGYFGVPLSNFFGWYLTVWLVFQSYAAMIRRWPALFPPPRGTDLARWRLLAVLVYLAMGLSQILPWLLSGDGRVVDPGGVAWSERDIHETAVIVMSCTMLPSGLLALLKLLRAPG
jgi:putative membrane protein